MFKISECPVNISHILKLNGKTPGTQPSFCFLLKRAALGYKFHIILLKSLSVCRWIFHDADEMKNYNAYLKREEGSPFPNVICAVL